MIALLERPVETAVPPLPSLPRLGPNASLAVREMLRAGDQYRSIRPVRAFAHPPFGAAGPTPLHPAIGRGWQGRLKNAMMRHYGHNGSAFGEEGHDRA